MNAIQQVREYTDPEEITTQIAERMETAWNLEARRLEQAFRDSLTDEQKELRRQAQQARNETQIANYWKRWMQGLIMFTEANRILPRFPGFPRHKAEVDKSRLKRFDIHTRRHNLGWE